MVAVSQRRSLLVSLPGPTRPRFGRAGHGGRDRVSVSTVPRRELDLIGLGRPVTRLAFVTTERPSHLSLAAFAVLQARRQNDNEQRTELPGRFALPPGEASRHWQRSSWCFRRSAFSRQAEETRQGRQESWSSFARNCAVRVALGHGAGHSIHPPCWLIGERTALCWVRTRCRVAHFMRVGSTYEFGVIRDCFVAVTFHFEWETHDERRAVVGAFEVDGSIVLVHDHRPSNRQPLP